MNVEIDLELEDSCAKCYGSGKSYETGLEQTCTACNGTGRYLTDLGEKIIKMLQSRFKLEAK